MGRSEKKVKADRVNAIRKQYEAYLEEDKKRKERNEYILGKLDKMRTCSNVVQQKYQSNHLVGVQNPMLHKKNISAVERPTRDVSLNRPVANLCIEVAKRNPEDDLLLKEIVSNYILIPKRHSSAYEDTDKNYYAPQRPMIPVMTDTDTNPNVHNHDTADNNDWRSKYEILNKLKSKEKGELDEETPEIFKSSDDKSRKDSANKCAVEMPQSKYDYERDVRSDDGEIPSNTKCEENNKHVVDLSTKQNNESVNDSKYCRVPQTVDKQPLGVCNKRFNNSESIVKKQENSNSNPLSREESIFTVTDKIKELPEQIIPIAEEKVADCVENKIDLSQAPYSEPIKNVNETFEPESKYSDDTEIPAQVIHAQEIESVQDDNVHTKEYVYDQNNLAYAVDPDSYTGANLEESDNMNSGIEPSTEHMPEHTEDFDATADVAGIAAFEEEQNNLFYQEPLQNDTLHDELPVDNTYQNHDENYQQNQQYYYEGQEQTYPVEINEHEETQQPYDQNYVQQYSENYGNAYEQQQGYEEQQQGYEEQQQGYEEQPVFEQQPTFEHQEYDGQQGHVYEQQQELDHSQHYEQQAYDPVAYQEGYQQQPEGFEQYQQPIYDDQYQTENNETVEEIEQNLDKEEGYAVPEVYQNTSQQEAEKEVEKPLSPN